MWSCVLYAKIVLLLKHAVQYSTDGLCCEAVLLQTRTTVSSQDVNLQHFKLSVSNPRTMACVQFNMPFESSNLPGDGPVVPD